MLDTLRELVISLSTFEWAIMLFGWVMLAVFVVLSAWRLETQQNNDRIEALIKRASLVADRLDEAADALLEKAPGWFPEDVAEAMNEDLAAYEKTAKAARMDAEIIRRRIVIGRLKKLRASLAGMSSNAERLMASANRIKASRSQEAYRHLSLESSLLLSLWTKALRGHLASRKFPPIPAAFVALDLEKTEQFNNALIEASDEERGPGEEVLMRQVSSLVRLYHCSVLLSQCVEVADKAESNVPS